MSNFNHLMLLYEQMYTMGLQVKQVVNEGNIQELDNIIRNKSSLIEKILRFEKTSQLDDEQKKEQSAMRTKIEEIEKENIELLQNKQSILKKELQNVSRGKKLVRAYMSGAPDMNSTIDIME